MLPLARAARARGYAVLNLGYPSRSAPVAELSAFVSAAVEPFAPGVPLCFVTHSLGGILLRAAVAAGHIPPWRIARVVMLAPPNQGSEVPDLFGRGTLLRRLFRRAIGPAGPQLGTTRDALPAQLPVPDFEFAVIAGTRSIDPFFSRYIPGTNDGKVSVARAAHPAMRALLVVPHTHTFLMRAPQVIRQTFHFLEHGAFALPEDARRGATR